MKSLTIIAGLWIAFIHTSYAQWFIETSAGFAVHNKKQSSFYDVPYIIPDKFSTTNKASSDTYQVGLGKRLNIEKSIVSSIDISGNLHWLPKLNKKGVVTNEATRYFFTMPLSSYRLMTTLKTNFGHSKFSPYVSLGAGISMNTSKAFSAASSDPIFPTPLSFRKNSRVSFAYQAGLGIDYRASKNWEFSLGYLYSNAGQTGPRSVGSAMRELPTTSIKNSLITHEFHFGVRYAFG